MPPKESDSFQNSNESLSDSSQQRKAPRATPAMDKDNSNERAPTTTEATSNDQFSSAANRIAIVNEYLEQGAMHNPTELPRVDGNWHWLEPADHERAQALECETPIDVTVARSNSTIGIGPATPSVIFVPNQAHLNLNQEPEGDGYWTYVTVVGDGSARALAWLQLGGQDNYGFEDVQHPTARQSWELRQRMIAEGRDTGVFDGIDIAWLAVDPLSNTTANNGNATIDGGPVDQDLVDPKTHLRHDLSNGGEHDQTGADDLHSYRTINIKGSKYTCDVSTAIQNRPEPHKLWIPNVNGEWKQYTHHETMDWSKKEDLTKLNAWRDQALGRGGWPKKREETREVYTDDQKRWAFDLVDKNGGKPPRSAALKKIAVDFNKLWNADRTQAAISALCSRLAGMHEKTGGKFIVGPKRGWAKKAEAKLKRKKRESSGEDAPKKRRRKSSKNETEEDKEVKDSESGDEESGG